VRREWVGRWKGGGEKNEMGDRGIEIERKGEEACAKESKQI